MEFSELVDSDRRLVILRALEEDAGYSLNESVIQSVLEALGHNVRGITRIGVGKGFLHLDIDRAKDQRVIWLY